MAPSEPGRTSSGSAQRPREDGVREGGLLRRAVWEALRASKPVSSLPPAVPPARNGDARPGRPAGARRSAGASCERQAHGAGSLDPATAEEMERRRLPGAQRGPERGPGRQVSLGPGRGSPPAGQADGGAGIPESAGRLRGESSKDPGDSANSLWKCRGHPDAPWPGPYTPQHLIRSGVRGQVR